MTFEQIINFLKTNIWGLIILGALGSVFGTLLLYLLRKFYFWLAKKYKIFRTKAFLKRIVERYSEGYIAGMAAASNTKQSLLIGRYILELIINSLILIVQLIISFGLLSFLPFEIFWIVVFITGIVIVFPIRKIRKTFWLFNRAYEQGFDQKEISKKANEYLVKTLDEKNKKKE